MTPCAHPAPPTPWPGRPRVAYPLGVTLGSFLILSSVLLAACGASTAPTNPTSPADSGLACGDVVCTPSEICLYPACGCLAIMEPLTDAGTCPDGSTYFDAEGTCVVPPACQPPSCVSLTPGAGSFDCSSADAAPGCDTVVAPIPASCSRVCRGICV
jgi:hypothetical protein